MHFITHYQLRQFTKMMFRYYSKQNSKANMELMNIEDYRNAVAYYEFLTGTKITLTSRKWVSLTGKEHWMDVVNELSPDGVWAIQEVVNTKGSFLNANKGKPDYQLKIRIEQSVNKFFQ